MYYVCLRLCWCRYIIYMHMYLFVYIYAYIYMCMYAHIGRRRSRLKRSCSNGAARPARTWTAVYTHWWRRSRRWES